MCQPAYVEDTKKCDGQPDGQTGRQTEILMDKWIGKQTDRWKNRMITGK